MTTDALSTLSRSLRNHRRGSDRRSTAAQPQASRLECLQVRGGNTITDTAFSTTGLDVWLYCKPYGNAVEGGDIYALSSCSSGRITRLALADVRGHGSTVLTLANSLRRLMGRHIDHINQDALVRAVNREFVTVGDASDFATALIATFFVPTRTLSLTNAGHPAPLLFNGRRRAWRPLERASTSDGLADVPLGMFEHTSYTQVGVTMTTDDLLLCYTDGLEEAVDDTGEMLGRAGVARIVADTDPSEPAAIIPAILRRVTAMSAANLTGDDVTLMLIRPNGAAVPWRDNLLAPVRYLGNLIRTRLAAG